jgi:hypothetical protein
MSVTAPQLRILTMLSESPLTEYEIVIHRIQRRTMTRLCEQGLAKFRPYGTPRSWAITKAGTAALKGSK